MQEEKLRSPQRSPNSELTVHITVIACLANTLVFFRLKLDEVQREPAETFFTIASPVSSQSHTNIHTVASRSDGVSTAGGQLFFLNRNKCSFLCFVLGFFILKKNSKYLLI